LGEDVEGLLSDSKAEIKKIATARIIFTGKQALIDYNWSIKQVQASSSIKDLPQNIVHLELILLNEKGENVTKVLEFSQEEFASFVKTLESTLK
jgi:hypothetical protein